MAPATAPTPVPMSAPLPAPYPVPAPTAAPAPAPTAAPPTVPQAVTVKLSIDNPTIHAISRFVITSLLVDSTFKAEADRRRRRPRAHLGARGRASLTASDDFDVRPQVRRGAYRGIRLLPQLPIAGLREDHGPAHGGSSTDRTDDLDHSYTLAPKVLELHSPSGGRSDTAGIGEVAHLELLVRLRELPSLYDSAHRSRRPGRQQVDELVAELVRGGLVQAASQLAVRRRGSAAGHCEHIHTHGAICSLTDQAVDPRCGKIHEAVELPVPIGVEQPDLRHGGWSAPELPRQLLSDLIRRLPLQARERHRACLFFPGAQLAAADLQGVVHGQRHVLAPDAGHLRGQGLGRRRNGRGGRRRR